MEAKLAAKDEEIEALRAENEKLKHQLQASSSSASISNAPAELYVNLPPAPPSGTLTRNVSESLRASIRIEEIRHCRGGKPRIGLLMFRGFEMLDVFGPLEMIGLLMRMQTIELLLVSAEKPDESTLHVQADPTPDRLMAGNPPSSFGPFIKTDILMEDCPELDMLLVPGGMGTRDIIGDDGEILNAQIIDWIKKQASAAKLVLTICTGSVLVAATGLLDGKEATTNKMAFDWVSSTRPAVQWRRGPRWCEDGKWISSAGVSAGLDGVLHAIALMYSEQLAQKIALIAEYSWQRSATSADEFANAAHTRSGRPSSVSLDSEDPTAQSAEPQVLSIWQCFLAWLF
jgi:transcriptional regulator GlxA family with amidase domain